MGVEALDRLSVRLATADLGLFMLSGSPSFQPGTCPDLGLFWMFSQKRSRPPASQSDPTLTWSALDGLDALVCCWLDDWIRMMAAGEEGLWGGGDFLLPSDFVTTGTTETFITSSMLAGLAVVCFQASVRCLWYEVLYPASVLVRIG